MLKKGKKKKEEAEKKTASDAEQQGKVSESDSAGAEANPGELISSLSKTFEKNNKYKEAAPPIKNPFIEDFAS